MFVSDEEIIKSLSPQKRKNISIFNDFNGTYEPIGVVSDYWNLYLYGDVAKVVYFKRGVINKKLSRKEKFEREMAERDKAFFNKKKESPKDKKSGRFVSSLKRTKATVFELAMCNEFKFFCTLTLDKEKRDRYDLSTFRKTLSQFIRNKNRNRENKITYLCIPEKHKDGAWHIHGLFSGLTAEDLTLFKLSDNIPKRLKNMIRDGKNVYNWRDYAEKFGYFSATEIKSREACSRYVTKYITKDLLLQTRESGARLFFASQGLKRKECVVKHCFEACPFGEYEKWDFENEYVKIKEIKLS